ncbi:L-alanine-DL-glutamate epimerase [Tistlia consotensis]|uniref:Dipeptide epimerase n=1 Tax=Tistlia consotensis USBA 355 TaxID=560819 RepID=A0A1Y6C271_9PROT|nr:N-acetyl-D-Glu racemase DgcA [Tistlia consotensis]SMF38244.1 L-alanine-DL-glutamate epimerase [Tistlia consotensis USBA 355]SNR37264.1 L-alanine-DL-glutamate epimerase [Tistlia consotensis]
MQLTAEAESWRLAAAFTISRGTKTHAQPVVATLSDGGQRGRGECVPYARYGETIESVLQQIEGLRPAIEAGRLDRQGLQSLLPAGAARNALDCAFWDLEAKRAGRPAWALAGLAEPGPVTTAYTLSLDTPEKMGRQAAANATRPLLKLKLAGPEDLERVRAVRANALASTIVVDANEGWTVEHYNRLAPALKDLGVAMIEQPFPAGEDAVLHDLERPVPLCADESCHDASTLDGLVGKYDIVNLKLDKTGGLTEGLKLKARAAELGFELMVGCMVATSLAMAPALLLAQGAKVVDLDGPLLLAEDREPPLRFEGSTVFPAEPALWG